MNQQEQREAIMRLLGAAVDACLQEADDRRYGDPRTFMADMRLVFTNVPSVVRYPALDFTQPLEPQLVAEAEEVTERTIMLNGTRMAVEESFLTYEGIVFLACGDKTRVLSVVCACKGLESQVLAPGQSVRVREGMRINAMATNNG